MRLRISVARWGRKEMDLFVIKDDNIYHASENGKIDCVNNKKIKKIHFLFDKTFTIFLFFG